MSLYNLLFGENEHSSVLLAVLGFDESDIPRYRDCYLEGEYIVIHTRTGGGNRCFYDCEERCRRNYPEYFDSEDHTPSGPWNEDMRAHPSFVYDEDDDFDCTYADWYFSFPPEYADDLRAIRDKEKFTKPSDKWKQLLGSMTKAA